ncbi:MAG: VWA domain-containing protein [Xanthobacteraceae bacterium]|nr:VWA domain-containing protein [Xanthobacteraceae bacterium]
MMRRREALRPVFRSAWDALSHRFDGEELEAWANGVLTLAHVNAGPSCLIAYWNASVAAPRSENIITLTNASRAAADICREAGAKAATAALSALPAARELLEPSASARWWQVLCSLAHRGPESVETLASHMREVLRPGTIDAFEDFVAAGLKFASGNKTKRLSFFSLQEDLALRLLRRDAAGTGLTDVEPQVKAFVTALWGRPPMLRALESGNIQTQRRTSIAGPLIRLPEVYRGVQGEAARALYHAAAAHAQAHLVLGGERFPVGKLKPLQVALVTLIEDARIETLAIRQLPGLRRLWSPFHVAKPGGIADSPTLLARLARSLFDPSYEDDNGFIAKGRNLFAAAQPRIHDHAISREIGTLLGNDLGQMRVQFNAKTYMVEPIYRDDGLGLWDFGENAPSSNETIELQTDAARITQQQTDHGQTQGETAETEKPIGRARPVAQDERGTTVATYPEWDWVHSVERSDWTTVREIAAVRGDPRTIEDALANADSLRTRIAKLVRGVRIGKTVRLNRQHEGHDLDIDAMLDAGIALRSGLAPDPRVFRSATSKHRDLSVLLLIDVSESTRDRLQSGASVLDVERLAVAALSEAMSTLGDPFGLLAFASDGRDDVRATNIKSFDEPYDRACLSRLAGLTSGLSTRLGTALRHAGTVIGAARSARKLVIVLTDGEPSDIDVSDPLDLVEDARRAVTGLHGKGIDAFGVVLGQAAATSAARIFGRGNTMLVHRVGDLPQRLSELYFRLARH